jgi:hypothetical protein
LAPDEPLVVRRHELAVLQSQGAVRRVVEQCVVERSRPLRVALGDAGHEPDLVLARDLGEPVGGLARNLERFPSEQGEGLLRARLLPPGQRARPDRRRIGRDERLRKDEQLGVVARGLGGQAAELLDRRVAVEDDWLGLEAGNGDRGPHGAIVAQFAP